MEVRLEQLPKNRLPSAHTVILSHRNSMEGFNVFNSETTLSSLEDVSLHFKNSAKTWGSVLKREMEVESTEPTQPPE